MLTVFQWSQHPSSLISCGSGEPDESIYLMFSSVGCWKMELPVHNVDSNAMKELIEARRGGFEYKVPFMLDPSGQRLDMVLVFSERGFCLRRQGIPPGP